MGNGTWEGRNLDIEANKKALLNMLNRNCKSPENEASILRNDQQIERLLAQVVSTGGQ